MAAQKETSYSRRVDPSSATFAEPLAMMVMRRFGVGIILVVGLAATVQPLLAAQPQRNDGRQVLVGKGSNGPDDCEGKDCNTDTYGASFAGRGEGIQAARDTAMAANKHGAVLGAGELSALQQIQMGKAVLQSANKLTSATNDMTASAMTTIHNVKDRIRGLTADGAAYDQPRGAATIIDSQHPGRSGGRYTSYSRSSRTQEDLATSTNTADRKICKLAFDDRKIGVDVDAGEEYWTMDGYTRTRQPCAEGEMCVVYSVSFFAYDEPMEGWRSYDDDDDALIDPTTGEGICMSSSLTGSCANGKVYELPGGGPPKQRLRFCITPTPKISGSMLMISGSTEPLSLEAEGPLAISYKSGDTKRIVYFPGSKEYKLPSK